MKVGILGGGQLGRMLLQAAANYMVEVFILEKDENCPAAAYCRNFVKGDINNFDDVYQFGKNLDALTIEIEAVNVEALEKLEKEGVKIFPKTAVIKTIRNKIHQKEFYKAHRLRSPEFTVTQSKDELFSHKNFLPAVHKLGEGAYDGRGVQVLKNEGQMKDGFDAPAVLEKMVAIDKEIAVIVAMNEQKEIAIYPVVEMTVDPELNLLDYQVSPAVLNKDVTAKANALALQLIKAFDSPGLFAVEMFIDKSGEVLVNETAPRVHNSGHHTIEANFCSQYDMLWRIILGYPLGNTAAILPSSIVNLIGAEGYSGRAEYKGLHEVLKMGNTFVHIYGKTQTKPGRKMGHVTILGENYNELIDKAKTIKNTIHICASIKK